MTVSPLGRRYFSNLRSGSAARAGIAQSAAARTKTRRSTCCLLPKGTALLLPTLPRRKPGPYVPAPARSKRDQSPGKRLTGLFVSRRVRGERREKTSLFFLRALCELCVNVSRRVWRRARCGRRRARRG